MTVRVGGLGPFAGDPPVTVGRDAARDAARHELSDPAYDDPDEPLIVRVARWVTDALKDLLGQATEASPGGALGVLVLAALAVVVILLLRSYAGAPARNARRRATAWSDDRLRTAAEYRDAAEAHAANGAWAEAVRERLRAMVRDLEERGLLTPLLGRTVDETAHEAAFALPERASDLQLAARLFDDVWYGGRPATAETDRQMRAAVQAVHDSTPAPVGAS